jgi:hypothetical protein
MLLGFVILLLDDMTHYMREFVNCHLGSGKHKRRDATFVIHKSQKKRQYRFNLKHHLSRQLTLLTTRCQISGYDPECGRAGLAPNLEKPYVLTSIGV